MLSKGTHRLTQDNNYMALSQLQITVILNISNIAVHKWNCRFIKIIFYYQIFFILSAFSFPFLPSLLF